MIVWLLIAVVLGSDNSPRTVVGEYPSERACQVDAAALTKDLVSDHINRGFINCQKIIIGEFS